MYSLTVEEYIELTRRIIAEETKKQINEKLNQKSVEKAEETSNLQCRTRLRNYRIRN